jgi:hypothetical protein
MVARGVNLDKKVIAVRTAAGGAQSRGIGHKVGVVGAVGG